MLYDALMRQLSLQSLLVTLRQLGHRCDNFRALGTNHAIPTGGRLNFRCWLSEGWAAEYSHRGVSDGTRYGRETARVLAIGK
jgi:hypothetical protein